MATAAAPVRVGWVSTAQISRKNLWALNRSGAGVVAAVASRDLAKAAAYAETWGVPVAYGSYAELLADATIDAVYVPLPATLHEDVVLAAAAAGKGVLVEKPAAGSLASLQRMASACKRAGVPFMDGVMFQHSARLPAMAAYLHAGPDGPLGRLRSMASGFTFPGSPEFHADNIRVGTLEPSGCLGDLAWYNVRFALFAFRGEMPTRVSCTVLQRSPAGTPTEATGTLFYADDKVAQFTVGFHTAFRQWVEVAGTKGTLALRDFVLNGTPAVFEVTEGPHLSDLDRRVHIDPVTVSVAVEHGQQETDMWRNFCGMVRRGAPERAYPRLALQAQAILDALVESGDKDGARVGVADIGDDY